MAKVKTADEVVQDLVLIVKQKREEIAKAERPNWITNGSFKYFRIAEFRSTVSRVVWIFTSAFFYCYF
jgi:hypothetical protein